MAQRSVGTGSGGFGSSLVGFNYTKTPTAASQQSVSLDTLFNGYSPLEERGLTTAAAAAINDIVPPTTSSGMFIIPSAGNTATITLVDSGNVSVLSLGKTGINFLSFDNPPPTHVYLKTGSSIVLQLVFV